VRRLVVPVVSVVLGVALVALLVYGLAAKAPRQSLDRALAAGGRPVAPTRGLPVLDAGTRRSLSAYRGQVVVLNFWASWCESCKAEVPMLEAAQRTLSRHRATVLGVTYQDAVPDARSFVTQHGMTYPQLRDVDGSFARLYGTDALPESFLIDRRGRVALISRGPIAAPFLRAAETLAASA